MAKKRKQKRDTLALVESPAQLLNVIEWAHSHGAEKATRLAVLPPRETTTRLQLEAMVELAQDAGMSTRQLERLFRRYLNRSPKRYYMETRLARARNLLMQTDMSIIEIALASGFSSPSHFSKCYRAFYGGTPYRERGTGGGTQA